MFFDFLVRFGHSENSLLGRLLSTLNLAYERRPTLVRRVSVEKLSILLIVEGYFFVISILRPSNRVIWPFIVASSVEICELALAFITASSVETCEFGAAWTSVGLRPVQSSPFPLSLVSYVCPPCCACSFVLHVSCPCFRFSSLLLRLPGLQPSLLVGPRRCLFLLLLPCLSPSLPCRWSCRCLVGSRSCINSLPLS